MQWLMALHAKHSDDGDDGGSGGGGGGDGGGCNGGAGSLDLYDAVGVRRRGKGVAAFEARIQAAAAEADRRAEKNRLGRTDCFD
jgi:hypothetical protein